MGVHRNLFKFKQFPVAVYIVCQFPGYLCTCLGITFLRWGDYNIGGHCFTVAPHHADSKCCNRHLFHFFYFPQLIINLAQGPGCRCGFLRMDGIRHPYVLGNRLLVMFNAVHHMPRHGFLGHILVRMGNRPIVADYINQGCQLGMVVGMGVQGQADNHVISQETADPLHKVVFAGPQSLYFQTAMQMKHDPVHILVLTQKFYDPG